MEDRIAGAGRYHVPMIALLIFFALALSTAAAKSPTVDESIHILRGRTVWQTGQFNIQYEHPPLSHWLNGALLFTEPTLPNVTDLPAWPDRAILTLSRELLWQNNLNTNLDRTVLLARFPIILVGLLAGAMVLRWARELARRQNQPAWLSVLIAGTLFAFSPNCLASFSLATTDGPLTAVYLAVIFTLWRFWQRPSFWRWLFVAVALGLAFGTKITAVLLFPIILILSYTFWRRDQPWWRPGLISFSFLPIAGLTLWALYSFEWQPVSFLPFSMPAATYLESLNQVLTHIQTGHEAFLLGETSFTGWWYYFVVAFLIKTPLPTLFLLATGIVVVARQHRWRATIYLWLPASILFVVASYARLNIGYRHILPVLPFVFLLAAETASLFPKLLQSWRVKRPFLLWTLPVLLLWYVIGGLRQHPHYLAYFNELVGGSAHGYRYLGSSNLDWGQDLKLLADYVNQPGQETINYSYYGAYAADPAYYGLSPRPLYFEDGRPHNFAPANPAPGIYALSATHIQTGIGLPDQDLFDWFRRQEPFSNLGYSILLYRVAQAMAGGWVGYCLDPGPLLEQETAVQILGQTQLRHVYFDCHNSWVFPDGGQPGWYILPQQDTWPLAETFPDHLRLVYRHATSTATPSYEVYYWDGQADLMQWSANLHGETSLANDLPVRFGDVVDLTGYSSSGLEWQTAWQIQAMPTEPLTIAAHLYSDAPTPAVADGLGFTSEQWQPGDWFIQFHYFENGENGRYLETGLYNYLTGQQVLNDQGGTFIQLPRQ